MGIASSRRSPQPPMPRGSPPRAPSRPPPALGLLHSRLWPRLLPAQRVQDHALLLGAQHALGSTLLFLGEYGNARIFLVQDLVSTDPQQHRALAFLFNIFHV